MAVATRGTASNYLQRAPSPSGLADVVDLILDKGLVIDAYGRVAVIGIEVVSMDAGVVLERVDADLRFAEAVYRRAVPRPDGAGSGALRKVRAGRADRLLNFAVLGTALERGTVLPLRFGIVFEDEDSLVADFLRPRHDELVRLLRELRDRVELRVTAHYREQAILGEI